MAEITIRVSDRLQRIAGVVLGGIILAGVVLFLRSSGLFVPKYRLRVYVPEVAGLGVGASVRLEGIDVGTVSGIRLSEAPASPDRKIQLLLQVDKRYQEAIRSDSTAAVTTQGLLGNRYVSIHRGFSASLINPEGEIPSAREQTVTIVDVFNTVSKILDCTGSAKNSADDKTQPSPRKKH